MIATQTFLGGVDYIKIDGTAYDVYGPDGVTIIPHQDIASNLVVGRAAPRVIIKSAFFVVEASLPENTLELLHIAWNTPTAVSLYTSGDDKHDYLYLGMPPQTPTEHTLEVSGYDRFYYQDSDVLSTEQQRLYHFHRVVAYNPQHQQLHYDNIAIIPVRFLCIADPTQPATQEFGYIKRVSTEL